MFFITQQNLTKIQAIKVKLKVIFNSIHIPRSQVLFVFRDLFWIRSHTYVDFMTSLLKIMYKDYYKDKLIS